MRQVFFDTETTGIKPPDHRVIEIGCVEVINRKLTGNHFHAYINPQREVDEGAFRVHGLGYDQLKDKPLFEEVADEFIAFVDGAEILAHNAPFDVGFLNSEFKHINKTLKLEELGQITDTLKIARQLRPRQRNSLDALCQFYGVENSHRKLHGALLDAELLANMYLKMTAGQHHLELKSSLVNESHALKQNLRATDSRKSKIIIKPSADELSQMTEVDVLWDI
ncbi:MAG: DNA polymerase III subunit epsilon [Gammaproteobacteria bacterium]|nr:DNA polymerase III subunit epsilon [Gammaproteobacteria bacterium]